MGLRARMEKVARKVKRWVEYKFMRSKFRTLKFVYLFNDLYITHLYVKLFLITSNVVHAWQTYFYIITKQHVYIFVGNKRGSWRFSKYTLFD